MNSYLYYLTIYFFIFNQSVDLIRITTTTTTTTTTTKTIQTLVTKPNSYIYEPDESEDILERKKREPTPFVCKSKNDKNKETLYLTIELIVYLF